MLYSLVMQNLRLQVSVPDSAETSALDKVVREFNDHLMTFNGGRSVELFESKEVKLLIFTLISFILGMQKKQDELEEKLRVRTKPIVARIHHGQYLLCVRTIREEDFAELAAAAAETIR